MTTSDRIESDVVIVGSGMGGATTAYALAKKGVNVLVLERGERIPKEDENWSPKAVFVEKRYKPDEIWLDKDNNEYGPGLHYVVGGNTKVYGASLPRFKEADFGVIQHEEGISPAWPFTYKDLEPYYYQAEVLYKVHGTKGDDPMGPVREKEFPYPAMPHEPYVADLAERLKKAGVRPYANAMGVDLATDGKCIRCKTCDGFVCKVDAKSDAEINALNPAIATGKVKLMTGAKVEKVVLTADGKSVDHLLVETKDGVVKVFGKKFVLSAGGVNSAVILLKSGVANSSDMVGRNFMMHNNAHIAAFDIRRKNDITFQKTMSFADWYYDGGKGYPFGVVQLIGKVQGIMAKSWATKVPLPLLNFVMNRSVEFVVMAEDLPSKDNRVTVDSHGRIKVTRNSIGMKTHAKFMKKTKAVLRKAGYQAIFVQPFDISMNSHQCGTTVAGNDPRTSVVDQYCKTHDVNNLWLIDAGFMPSSAAMNPALTIAAQALRIVEESDLAKS